MAGAHLKRLAKSRPAVSLEDFLHDSERNAAAAPVAAAPAAAQAPPVRKPFWIEAPPTPAALPSWELDLWLDVCTPSSWEALQGFVVEHVSRMESGDRGASARPEDSTDRVMARLDKTVVDWKARNRKAHALVGGVNTGKTMMLRLLAAKHNMDFVAVHEDSTEDLRTLLKSAHDTGLDPRSRLWVIEHFDMYDAACKRMLRTALPRMLMSGPVFLTVWPSFDARSLASFQCSSALGWTIPTRLAFLDRFGKPDMNWSDSFADAGSDLGKTLSQQQLSRGIRAPQSSLRLCNSSMCGGSCALCMSRRRIPSNARLLVEDTLCPRTSDTKLAMLAETDADLHIMLLQELVPLAAPTLESMCTALDALSMLDCVAGFSTMVKDGFITGAVQNVCKSTSTSFSSGTMIPIPKCLFGNNRLTAAALGDIEKRVQLARGVVNPRLRGRSKAARPDASDDSSSSEEDVATTSKKSAKRPRSGKGTDGLVVLENDAESNDQFELSWVSPEADMRDYALDVSLFEQAAGKAQTEAAKKVVEAAKKVGSKRKPSP
jgi:hypothetical protein